MSNDQEIRMALIKKGLLKPPQEGEENFSFKPARSHKPRMTSDIVRKGGVRARQYGRGR